jgi:hypothetical protein
MLHKYRDAPDVMVQSGRALYPLNDQRVTAKGADFIKEYPREKTFVATVRANGGRNGSYRNAASLTNERMPPAALEALRDRVAEPHAASRFAQRPTRRQPRRQRSHQGLRTITCRRSLDVILKLAQMDRRASSKTPPLRVTGLLRLLGKVSFLGPRVEAPKCRLPTSHGICTNSWADAGCIRVHFKHATPGRHAHPVPS